MEILNKPSKEKWENAKGYQWHVTISSTKPEEIDAERPEGYITGWDIENQKWQRGTSTKVVLKSLDNSSGISKEFLNEIKSHIQIYFWGILQCYGITQDPNTKDYMMVLPYCEDGSLRNYYLNNHKEAIQICKGLRPKIFEGTPKLLADLIMKCWDATAENRPTTKELQLPEPSSQLYSDATPSVSANPISECLDVQLSELDLIEIEQDENNIIDDLN
ncbi:unnamed protein product [Rhizophagus irregularis]|uniref:Serine-threonine/tyrosine-protein kinase catalytic domain-containing protein n=1 Tax=Rhizophagus irregularis TaxID=588596 RepID=A0A915ZPP5_9GLOM|nr:unnamed protein product [Rhizophagus irregularis]CAB5182348.1 unnamed protein product [Rhizophagus irregularis]CAB5386149.1 unnamed protein product [Rhizophagus irregularis]